MRSIALLVMLGACAGTTADAPLTVKLGGSRATTTAMMREHQYCHQEQQPQTRYENYPRCERLGPEWGESWVTATFADEKAVEISRWERFSDPNRATERWNQLI